MNIKIEVLDDRGEVVGETYSDDNHSTRICYAKKEARLSAIRYTLLDQSTVVDLEPEDCVDVHASDDITIKPSENGFVELS